MTNFQINSNFQFYKLRNGVRVVLVPMEGVESTAVGVFVETGSRYETAKINGISHFLEHMVFKGTKKFPTHRDTSYLEGLGAIQNAWTDVDATAYWCKIPADKWKEGLDLVKDLVLYPTFPPKDLEIERGVILEEINRREDRPDEIVEEEVLALMYGDNSLAMTVLGESGVIKSVRRDDFAAYHDSQYVAGRIVVALAGKLESAECKKQIEEWFGGLQADRGREFVRWEGLQKEPRVRIRHKDLAAQAHVDLSVFGYTLSDPRRFALALLTTYLGQGLSSRLFLELREKRGLCYAVSAGTMKLPDTGTFGVYAGLNVGKLEEAIKAILEELVRVKLQRLNDEELATAKEKVRGPTVFSAENPVNVMNYYAKQALDRPEEILSYEQAIERVMQIDAEEVQKVAQSIFLTQGLNLAIVGPVEENRKEELLNLMKF